MAEFDNFVKNVRIVRTALQLSAVDLSKKAGLRQQKRVNDLEDGRGKPNIEEVMAICKVLGYPIDDMIYKKANVVVAFEEQ